MLKNLNEMYENELYDNLNEEKRKLDRMVGSLKDSIEKYKRKCD